VSVVSFVTLWWIVSLFYEPLFLPGPMLVFEQAIDILLNESFFQELSLTLLRVIIAFSIALCLAVLFGLMMGLNKAIEQFLETFVIVGLTMPAVAVTIIMLMVFGMNNIAAVATIVFVITPLMTENIWEGAKDIDRELIEMAQVFNSSRGSMLRSVIFPQLIPYVLAAARFGLGAAWKIVVIAEFFGLGTGIGSRINEAFELFSLSGVLAWTLSFVILMTVIEFTIIKTIERRLTRWRVEDDHSRVGKALFQS
jgi:NitT/TauT family transport system permease protein